jgi:hypothetical protein
MQGFESDAKRAMIWVEDRCLGLRIPRSIITLSWSCGQGIDQQLFLFVCTGYGERLVTQSLKTYQPLYVLLIHSKLGGVP